MRVFQTFNASVIPAIVAGRAKGVIWAMNAFACTARVAGILRTINSIITALGAEDARSSCSIALWNYALVLAGAIRVFETLDTPEAFAAAASGTCRVIWCKNAISRLAGIFSAVNIIVAWNWDIIARSSKRIADLICTVVAVI
jgi:hypothetical protein